MLGSKYDGNGEPERRNLLIQAYTNLHALKLGLQTSVGRNYNLLGQSKENTVGFGPMSRST